MFVEKIIYIDKKKIVSLTLIEKTLTNIVKKNNDT